VARRPLPLTVTNSLVRQTFVNNIEAVGKTAYKTLVTILVLAGCGFMMMAMRQAHRQAEFKIAIRHAHDKIWLFHTDCDQAIKNQDITNAVITLQKLQLPATLSEYADSRTLQAVVESNRLSAIAQIIDSLRQRTGTNCGPDPTAWIMTFGDAQTRDRQQSIEEWSRDLTAENAMRLKHLGY
jgi:hypothetical protein